MMITVTECFFLFPIFRIVVDLRGHHKKMRPIDCDHWTQKGGANFQVCQ